MDIVGLSAAQISRHVRAGELSAVEVAKAFLDRIAATDEKVKAWVHVAPEVTLAAARAYDASRGQRATPDVLAGVPVGVKDIFNTKTMPTQMGSPIWKDFTPGNDARAVHHLQEAGAVVLGKTVTAEFAVHDLRETLHPHDPTRNPGTSSTGSAVAVAVRQAPIALGTQTAGSIVRPASYCGVYGFKPSFGLIPRTAMLKTTDSLDTIGFFVRAPEDLRLGLDVLRVRGRDYPLSDTALNDKTRQEKPANRPFRVAFVKPHTWSNAKPFAREACDAALERWTRAGIEVTERALPSVTTEAHDVHRTIYDRALAYYFQGEYQKARLISPVFKGMVEHGMTLNLADYEKALDRQRDISEAMDGFFGDVDAIVTLSVAGEPLLRTEQEPDDSCLLWTLAGLPAINVPALKGPSGLPMGLQVVARRYNDYLLVSLVEHLERAGLAPVAPYPEVGL